MLVLVSGFDLHRDVLLWSGAVLAGEGSMCLDSVVVSGRVSINDQFENTRPV